ncbi:MAG: hypothetical protein FWE24_06090 [Defluviitaleaceae bacterium]|nr:hypothetical protein [Defluviitaleaceae bacterium]
MPDFVARYMGLALFVIFAFWFKFIIGRSGKNQKNKKEKLMTDEREANFSRVQEIPEHMKYAPDISKLPVKEYLGDEKSDKAATMQERALKAAELPMLRLDPPMTNIDIKRAFGATNLETITAREENYEQYTRALSNWAAELIALDNYEDAEIILNICVDMKALFFLPYSLLCDIYEKTVNKDGLLNLQNKISNVDIIRNNESLFGKINEYISIKYSALNPDM